VCSNPLIGRDRSSVECVGSWLCVFKLPAFPHPTYVVQAFQLLKLMEMQRKTQMTGGCCADGRGGRVHSFPDPTSRRRCEELGVIMRGKETVGDGMSGPKRVPVADTIELIIPSFYCKSTIYYRRHNNMIYLLNFNITYIVILATCFDSYESSSGINIQ